MENTYSITKKDSIVVIEFTQPPDLQVFYAIAGELLTMRENSRFLWDLSQGYDLSPDHIRKIAEEGKERFEKANLPPRKVALVASKDVYFGLMRMFTVHRDQEGIRLRVFRDNKAAIEWLEAEPMDVAAVD